MRSLIVAALIMGIVLLFLLFDASSGSSPLSDTLPTLFIGGGVLGVALQALLRWRLWWLQKRIRRGVFGAKLTLKLLLMLGVVALLPGLVVYAASVFFLNRSI
ncbi:MAG: PAS domain-containing sensor histidine kinase, partial [Thiobacillus sp.]|nr:PAS domain-containing sensor histidine kinase [Thiobacillus sp.]